MSDSEVLDTQSVIESAEIASGVNGRIEDPLRRRLDALLGWFRQHGPYSLYQMLATRRQIVKLLARRLAIFTDIERHPEILDEEVCEPIFIIGFPRTGTTLLQSLPAADPLNRAMKAWRVREPPATVRNRGALGLATATEP
jgi:hypothetical protein